MPRILVVEDDNLIRENIMDILTYSGHDTSGAENGALAFEKLKQEHFDLVISDLIMPVMDGMALLRKIRADGQQREIPVILVTARADQLTRDEGMQSGATAYLTKPFDGEALLDLINKILT